MGKNSSEVIEFLEPKAYQVKHARRLIGLLFVLGTTLTAALGFLATDPRPDRPSVSSGTDPSQSDPKSVAQVMEIRSKF